MNKIDLKGLDQEVYTETLDNGLDIYLVPMENKKNYFISYATKFGSDVIEFIDEDKTSYKPPLGIAHFLEHKMFEQEDGVDPFTFFSKSGTDSNASTSFDSTQYICYGTKNFKENLRYLLDFVNCPYYTDDNVEKEKGIIAEEIKMYQDMPDFKLEMKLRECIFKDSPRRIDIAGSIDEINRITKEDLYTCYKNFYIPNNMFVLVVGNFKVDDAQQVIKDEISYKIKKNKAKIVDIHEQEKINEKVSTIKENVEVPKIALGLKISTRKIDIDPVELDLYLNMLTTIIFGASSEFREKARNEKLLNGLYMEWESVNDLKVFYLMAATTNPDKLIERIKFELSNISIKEKTFNRIKKVWIANEVKMIDNVDSTVSNIYDDIIKYNKIIPDKVNKIRSLKLKTLTELINKIDFNNISIVKMESKDTSKND